jgi:hypothetical protein
VPVVLLFVGLVLMVLAWAAATPLGQAADEPAHYVKALAAGRGQLHGDRPELANVNALAALVRRERAGGDRAAHQRALRFVADASGAFTLPRALVPERGCFRNLFRRADTSVPADCITRAAPDHGDEARFTTYVEAYPPYVYELPGLAMRAAGDDHAEAAYWLGRGVFALVALALLGLSLAMLWQPSVGAASLAGVMVALTPMALWSFSVLNTSGLEIAGAVCWTAGLVRLARGGGLAPPWIWAATAAGGVVLAVARPSGPVFVLFALVGVALVFGWDALRGALRQQPGRAAAVVAAVGVAVAAALFWQRYMPGYSLGIDNVVDSVSPALDGLPEAMREAVGRFAGDYFVPVAVAIVWALLLGVLVVAAARRQPRIVLLALVCALAIAAYATAYLTSGFDEFYGRYALPALVILPLCAGAVLASAAAPPRRLMVGLAFATAGLQLLVWWLESRRLAVGTDGSLWFAGDAQWSPPGGWALWIVAMLAGSALYVAAAVTSRARPTP